MSLRDRFNAAWQGLLSGGQPTGLVPDLATEIPAAADGGSP